MKFLKHMLATSMQINEFDSTKDESTSEGEFVSLRSMATIVGGTFFMDSDNPSIIVLQKNLSFQ